MAGSAGHIHFGAFALDRAARQILGPHGEVPLTPKAFALLTYLVEQRPRVVTKNELLEQVWPGVFVAEQNVKNLVAEVRAALDDRSNRPRFLRTVFGVGYAFCAEAFEDETPRKAGSRPPSVGVAAYLVSHETVYRVYAGDNLVGRDDGCAIVIDAAGVSRRHARVNASADGANVEDLESKNGTWVNGARVVGRRRLEEGDELRIGQVTMKWRRRIPRDTSTLADPLA